MRYATVRWYTEKFNVALESPESYDRRRKIPIGSIEGAKPLFSTSLAYPLPSRYFNGESNRTQAQFDRQQ